MVIEKLLTLDIKEVITVGRFADFVKSLTGDSSNDASRAGHAARDDGGFRDRDHGDKNFKSAPGWAESSGSSGVEYFPEGKGPGSSDDSK